jgi:peptide/nickel transport system permease protein
MTTQPVDARGHDAPSPSRGLNGIARQAWRFPQTKLGTVVLVAIVTLMVIGPRIAPHGPTDFVGIPASVRLPGSLFGTDALGRDVWSRFLHGGLTVLWMSLLSAVIGVLVGVIIGLVAAVRRGWVDELLMRSSDVVLAFPQIVLALLFVSWFGPNLVLIVLLVALSHAPRVARLVRATAMDVAEQDYVKAAVVLGVPRRRIMIEDILPNLTSPLLVDFGLRLIWSIAIIASLSFMGLGIQPPAADWGLMINENRGIIAVQPWAVLLPTIGISLYAVGVNLITEGFGRAIAGTDRAAL